MHHVCKQNWEPWIAANSVRIDILRIAKQLML
jgi:hypothetical protein